MKVTLTPDQKSFNRFHAAVRDLMKISGKDFESVMKQEMGAVLSGAVRNTKKASAQKIKANHAAQPGAQYRIDYPGPISRTGKTYSDAQVARLSRRAQDRRAAGKNGRLVYYFGGSNNPKRYPDPTWSKIQDFRNKAEQRKLKARGLTASMWVRIGERLGIPIKAPGYVVNAETKKGNMAQMVSAYSRGAGNKYELGFVNSLTKQNKWTRAGIAFRSALNKRANFFGQAVKLAAGSKIQNVLARYPGLATFSGRGGVSAGYDKHTGSRGGTFEVRTSASGRTYKKYL